MLKEVGTSGQISLGKKYAGQLFDVVFYPDGRVELVPMKAVPTVREVPEVREATVQTDASTAASAGHRVQEEVPPYRVGDGWVTPERLAKAELRRESTGQWAENHEGEIDQYNAWASQREPYSQRVRQWRESVVPKIEADKL